MIADTSKRIVENKTAIQFDVFGRFELLERITVDGDDAHELYRVCAGDGSPEAGLRLLPVAHAWGLQRPQLMSALARAAQLTHPGIAQVREFGTQDGFDYIVRDWVPGEPLLRLLALHRNNAEQHGLIWLKQSAETLDALHLAGMAHGGLTPARIIVDTTGYARLTDYGYAGVLPAQNVFQDYTAPECIDGARVTAASDQFALAVIAFEMLTGRALPPFDSSGLYRFSLRTAFAEKYASSVSIVMSRALAIDPASRYSTCTAFIDALTAACGMQQPSAQPSTPKITPVTPPAASAQDTTARHMGWATVIGVLLALAVVAAVIYGTTGLTL